MSRLSRFLTSAAFTTLAGCAMLSENNDGYDPVSKKKEGDNTIITLENGCIVTETIKNEPNLYSYHSEMKCPWDKDGPSTP